MVRWFTACIALALLLGATLGGRPATTAAQVENCQFVLGFATLHDMLAPIVGGCIENEWHNAENGDGLQRTTGGLLVWRKSDNWTAFTNGYFTWINGPYGLQARLNTERFPWESLAAPPAPPTAGSGGGEAGGGTPAPEQANQTIAAPSISIRIEDDHYIDQGDAFTIRVDASSEAGLDRIWWWATDTHDDDLRRGHTTHCHGDHRCRDSWDESTNDTGQIVIHARARASDGQESDEVTWTLHVRGPERPSIDLSVSNDRPDAGQIFTLRLRATSDDGLERIWWWATDTADEALREKHVVDCDHDNRCERTWDLSTLEPGRFVLHAQAHSRNDRDSDEVTVEMHVRAPSATPTLTPTRTPTATPSPTATATSSPTATTTPPPTAAPLAQPPTVDLQLSRSSVDSGDRFTVRIDASDDAGLASIWWWATGTDDGELTQPHSSDCAGRKTCNERWNARANDRGVLVIHAQARDIAGLDSAEMTVELEVH